MQQAVEHHPENGASVGESGHQAPSKSGLMARLAAAGSSSSRVVRGLGGVPATDRPILFVGNHQTYAPDLPILILEMLKQGITLRGLTHPIALGLVRHRNRPAVESLFDIQLRLCISRIYCAVSLFLPLPPSHFLLTACAGALHRRAEAARHYGRDPPSHLHAGTRPVWQLCGAGEPCRTARALG